MDDRSLISVSVNHHIPTSFRAHSVLYPRIISLVMKLPIQPLTSIGTKIKNVLVFTSPPSINLHGPVLTYRDGFTFYSVSAFVPQAYGIGAASFFYQTAELLFVIIQLTVPVLQLPGMVFLHFCSC